MARPITCEIDFAKQLSTKRRSEDIKLSEKYAFKDYIVSYWPWHVDGALKLPHETSLINDSFMQLITTKILPFEFRPWGPNRHFGPYGCNSCWMGQKNDTNPVDLTMTSMIHWLVEHGLRQLVGELGSRKATKGSFRAQMRHECYNKQSLLIACRHGQTDMLIYLVQFFSVEPHAFVEFCSTASASGHVSTLIYLLSRRWGFFSGTDRTEIFKTVLYKGATYGHVPVVEMILAECTRHESPDLAVFIQCPDEVSGLTPLHSASANGHYEVVRLLGGHCSDVDCKELNDDATALHLAAKQGHARVAEELLSRGAYLECLDSHLNTPLSLAARYGHAAVAKIILKKDLNYVGFSRALDVAAEYGHLSVVLVLCSRNSSGTYRKSHLDQKDSLALASANGHAAVVKCLLEQDRFKPMPRSGPQSDDYRPVGYTPLMWAAKHGHTEVVDILLDAGMRIDTFETWGRTAAGFAYLNGRSETLQRLYERGAKHVGEM